MLPFAPARLSTRNCWPRDFVNSAAIARATMSVPPPGAKFTTKRTGFAGYCCAAAPNAQPIAAAAIAAFHKRVVILFSSGSLSWRSLRLQVQILHDLSPPRVLLFQERGEFLRGVRQHLE